MSFNAQIREADRIYQVVSQVKQGYNTFINPGAPGPVATTIRKEVTGVENVGAFYMLNEPKVKVPEKTDTRLFIKQKNVSFANPGLLELLSYQWLSGSPQVSLSKPYQVVLTESKMEVYFGKTNPESVIGREIIYQDSIRVTVGGIVKTLKGNTDFMFTEFISMATLEQTPLLKNFYYDEWASVTSNSRAFVKLSAGTSEEQVSKQLADLSEKYIKQEDGFGITLQLQSLQEVHFKGSVYSDGPSLTNRLYMGWV
jgi:hypothetical protein